MNVKLKAIRQTGFACPTAFEGLVVIRGADQPKPFKARYRGGNLTVTYDHTDITCDADLITATADGVATWDELKEAAEAALRDHLAALHASDWTAEDPR